MRARVTRSAGPLFFVLLACISPAFSQDIPQVAQGANLGLADVASVDPATGRMKLRIPLLSDTSQRGNLNFNYSVVYGGTGVWQVVCNPTCTWTPSSGIPQGPTVIMEGALGVPVWKWTSDPAYWLPEAGGAQHALGGLTDSTGGGDPWRAVDGSGILVRMPGGWDVTNQSGIHFRYPGSYPYIQDSNGNLITTGPCSPSSFAFDSSQFAYGNCWTMYDTVGRQWSLNTYVDASNCRVANSVASEWFVPAPQSFNGGLRSFKLCWSPIHVQGDLMWYPNYDNTVNLLTAVILPDGTMWRFEYNGGNGNTGPGDITKIYLPTGGTITYDYTWTGDYCINNQWIRTPWKRTVYDGTTSSEWFYSTSIGGSPSGTTVTDPAGNNTVYASSCWPHIFTNEVRSYSGPASGTPLVTETKSVGIVYAPLVQSGYVLYPQAESTALANGSTKQVWRGFDDGFAFYDYWGTGYTVPYGLVNSVVAYDWGSGAPGPQLRRISTGYMAFANSNYLDANLLKLPYWQANWDVDWNTCAYVTYVYDDPARLVPSGVTVQHGSAPSTVRGNLSRIARFYRNIACQPGSSGSNVDSYQNVYDTGMVQKSIDARGYETTYEYVNQNPNWYGSRLSKVTNALGHTQNFQYDWPSGLLTWAQDPNANWTGPISYDAMLRPTSIPYPGGRQTLFTYSTYNGFMYTEEKNKIDSSRWTDTFTMVDGLGRISRLATANDESPIYDQVDTCYDARGNVSFTSYPFRNTGFNVPKVCSGAGDAFAYDALGRVTQVTHSDGSTVLSSYTGRATSVSDEGNGTQRVQKISQVDGLGRTVSVCEVTSATQLGSGGTPGSCGQDIAATGFLTTYTYDPLSNLKTVSQGGYLPRTFAYDSFSRVTSVSDPESGTTSYTYDNNDNVLTRIDARNITTTYAYDALNRLTSRTYSDTTPAAYFYYDASSWWGHAVSNPVGKLVAQGTYISSTGVWPTAENFTYDAMGRILQQYSCLPIICWSAGGPPNGYAIQSYGYDLIGNMTSSTNGVGVTLNYSYNRALRLTGVTSSLSDANHPGTLLSAAHYNAAGALLSATLDGTTVSETRTYDGRFRPTGITQTVGAGSPYTLTIPGNGYAPNSNLLATNDSANGNWTYSYDPLGRLAGANKNSGAEVYSYAYDRFGNRWQQNGPHTMSLSFGGNNNRMDGYTYDAAGNLLNDGTHTYAYDAENQLISVDGGSTASYVYNADGLRVRKTTAGGTVDFLRDLDGNEVAAVPLGAAWNRAEVYAGGRHLATYSGGVSGTIYFNFSDWLETERTRANMAGSATQTCTSLPFGDWLSCSGTDTSPMHFTGYERDGESGLDYASARHYISRMGRFASPDPLGGDTGDPQSLNRYAYVGNNPTNFIDPSGMTSVRIDGWSWDVDCDGYPFWGSGDCGSLPEWPWVISTGWAWWSSGWPSPEQMGSAPPSAPIGSEPFPGMGFRDVQVPPVILPSSFSIHVWVFEISKLWHALRGRPRMVSVVVPIYPVPGRVGVGPAFSVVDDPENEITCYGFGLGGTYNRNYSVGPLSEEWRRPGRKRKEIFQGWGVSGGYNTPWGLGGQGTASPAGAIGGVAVGNSGGALAATYGVCKDYSH